jgi:hypothetical protein
MRRLICGVLMAGLCTAAQADVVRPAPDFGIDGVARGTSLLSFRGQAVVLIVTRSAREKSFREMVARLREIYAQFSNEKVIFVAAIENGPAEVQSDIPFITASDPGQVASDYGINGRFGIAVIGVDGNLDFITDRVVAAERVRDMVFDNSESQSAARKAFGL